ncbi:MAG: hypothetical protein JWL59_4304 [Chthoniobacteraceae bacterium]|nr:hypothetical protein [Chthoniobacteraceae bacterium]
MRKTKVSTVDLIRISIESANGRISILARGTVPTDGWVDAELVDTPEVPDDGCRHFDFVAVAPEGVTPRMRLPIAAARTIQAGPGRVCVMVHAAINDDKAVCVELEHPDPIDF